MATQSMSRVDCGHPTDHRNSCHRIRRRVNPDDEASVIHAGTTWSEHSGQLRRVGTRHEGRPCNATVCVAQSQTCTRAAALNTLTMAKL
jgi:hypothetical protein